MVLDDRYNTVFCCPHSTTDDFFFEKVEEHSSEKKMNQSRGLHTRTYCTVRKYVRLYCKVREKWYRIITCSQVIFFMSKKRAALSLTSTFHGHGSTAEEKDKEDDRQCYFLLAVMGRRR